MIKKNKKTKNKQAEPKAESGIERNKIRLNPIVGEKNKFKFILQLKKFSSGQRGKQYSQFRSQFISKKKSQFGARKKTETG
jgi:hypothetical protein